MFCSDFRVDSFATVWFIKVKNRLFTFIDISLRIIQLTRAFMKASRCLWTHNSSIELHSGVLMMHTCVRTYAFLFAR